MTIEQLLVQCFYQNKKVGLQNIGSFELVQDVNLELSSDKDTVIPEGAIQFTSNSKQPGDEQLVTYIHEHTKKMKSLAASDLESYTSLQKEMIFLGKALLIPGIGTLHKSDAGNIEFTQGKGYEKLKETLPERKTSGMKEDVNYNAEPSSGNGKKAVLVLVAIILSALAVGAVYYFVNKNKNATSAGEKKEEKISSTTEVINKDSILPVAVPTANAVDSSTAKIVIRNYKTSAEATGAATKFKSYGHNTSVITKDSSNYLVAVSLYTQIGDTSRVLDSLKRLFDYKTYIY